MGYAENINMLSLAELREKWGMLGSKLLVSHLLIAITGGVFLGLSAFFHESLSDTVFRLVLDSSPRVGLLNNIETRLQGSQIILQRWIHAGSGYSEAWQQPWLKEIWPSVRKLEKQSKQHWTFSRKVEEMTTLKRLLSDIYVQQWKIADTANTPGDSSTRNLFHMQAFPQAVSMRNMIKAMILLEKRNFRAQESTHLILAFTRLRVALDSSLSALERMGYQHGDLVWHQYHESITNFNAMMDAIRKQKYQFSTEAADIFHGLDIEQAAYAASAIHMKQASTSISRQIFTSELQPLTKETFALLQEITTGLKTQLNHDTQRAVSQSFYITWGSRILIVLMMVLAIWIARMDTRYITNPLARLTRAASHYSTGNLTEALPEEGSTELATLSRTFNIMRASLQEGIGLMKSVLETAVNAIIMIDHRGKIESFNQAAERMFGWQASEIIGCNVSTLMPSPFHDEHDQYIHHYLDTKEARIIGIGREVVGQRKDGETFPIQLAVSHVEVNGRNIFTGIIVDISEQKKNQAELIAAKAKAESSSRAKAAFVANISHEIRTPMNAIIGFSEVMLQDKKLSSDTLHHAKIILSSSRSLLEIINDILDVSKLESGKFSLETVCFHLRNALTHTLEMIEYQAKEKKLNLRLEYAPTLPIRVMGDPTRLRQVILNMMSNAVKFTEKGSITLSVQAGEVSGMLYFTVTDTGIGMTEEQVAKVFESFAQADETTTRRFGGTGLGTTISKQIVELMGGKIWAESQHGQGSTFYFTVRMEEAVETEHCLFEEDENMVDAYISPRLFHILLAEDVEANASLAILRLEQQGHTVHWVKNGREAVEESQANAFDLVLMDIQMPEMDGCDATQSIRKIEKNTGQHLTVIAMTAGGTQENKEKYRMAGMGGMISKPIDFDQLFALMEKTVPEGVGQTNTMNQTTIHTRDHFDFSPLDGIVDHQTAMKTWREANVYAKALMSFATERVNNASEIEQILAAQPDNVESAHTIAHALKGVAGNLGLNRIAHLATAIDDNLKSGQKETIVNKLSELHQCLNIAATAIGKLQLSDQDSTTPAHAFDAPTVQALMLELATTLDELNPDNIEPVLNQLAGYITKTDLMPVRNGVEAFDFDRAKTAMYALKDKLHLKKES